MNLLIIYIKASGQQVESLDLFKWQNQSL